KVVRGKEENLVVDDGTSVFPAIPAMELDFLPHDLRSVELVHVVAGAEFPIVPSLVLALDQRLLEGQKVPVDRRVRFLEYLFGLLSRVGPGPVRVLAGGDSDEESIAATTSPSVGIPTSQQRSDYPLRFLASLDEPITGRGVDDKRFIESCQD